MVTITASAGAGGTIDPTGEVTVEEGGNQVFTFTPSTGYEVDTVLVGGVAVTVTGNTYEIENVTADTTIAVSFKEVTVVKHTITATAGAGGTIAPSGAVEVEAGADQIFTITAGNGFEIDDVLVGGVSVGKVGTYTFEDVSDDSTIAVSFKAVEPEPEPVVVGPRAKVIHDVFGATRVDVIHLRGRYAVGGVKIGLKQGIVLLDGGFIGSIVGGALVVSNGSGELSAGTVVDGISGIVFYK